MDKKRLRIFSIFFLILFLLADIAIASYIFSNTVRDNSPDWVYEPGTDIVSVAFSGGGNAFVYGTGNNIYFHYAYNPTSSRYYELDSAVKSLMISKNVNAFVAADMENNLYFLRYGSGPDMDLIFKVPFDKNIDLRGMVVLGETAQTTRFLASSEESIYIFSSRSVQPLLEYDFGERVNEAAISHYGDLTVAGTESGNVYFFRTFEETLEWQCQCDSAVTSIAISPFAGYALIGCDNGSVYLYDTDEQTMLWKKSIGSSVREVFIRSTATESLVLDSNNVAYLFEKDGENIKTLEDVDQLYMPYWSEYITYSSDDVLFLVRDNRNIDEWKYDTNDDIRLIFTDYGSSVVMLLFKDRIEFILEDQLMVYGSRSYWAGLAILILGQILVMAYTQYLQRSWIYGIIHNREFLEFFVGALFGLLAAGILAGSLDDLESINLIIGSISAGLASWQCSRVGGGLIGAFVGYITGLFGALAIGGAFGIYYWVGGAEENILSSLVGTAFYGGLLGAFYSIIGFIVGLVIKDYFEEYRRKRKTP